MGLCRHCMVLALILISIQSHFHTGVEARALPFIKQERYVKLLASLGVMCRCCDGVGGECRSTWDSSCPKLDCGPWKFH